MSLSKNKIKYIKSLDQKKNRKEEKLFVAEGPKLVGDLLPYFRCRLLVATAEWLDQQHPIQADEIVTATQEELSKASFLKTPQQVLALFEQPDYPVDYGVVNHSLCLALDDIQDPGNLGTIIRLADWFGIEHLFCSPNTVDVYSPKVIQATMGGIARVKVHYTPLYDLIKSANTPVYGTFLDGENIYSEALSQNGLIVMGNEGNGISKEIEQLINRKLYIPNYPLNRETSESLNVAVATAVVCAEFRRQAASPQN
ncbi:RNA methyltransferase [Bacteroides sp. OttesenSCG-928-F21]|nr:RNA methyltransferase [Bacteroides sp. OttesenSCG-928-F21]